MKLPFVSRASHDEALALANRRADAEHENAQHLRRDLSELTAKYHALRLQGAVVVERKAVPVPTITVTDPIRQAIREQVRANPDMRGLDAYLSDYARQLRDVQNVPADQIIERLTRWDSSEELSAPVESIVAVDAVDDATAEEAA